MSVTAPFPPRRAPKSGTPLSLSLSLPFPAGNILRVGWGRMRSLCAHVYRDPGFSTLVCSLCFNVVSKMPRLYSHRGWAWALTPTLFLQTALPRDTCPSFRRCFGHFLQTSCPKMLYRLELQQESLRSVASRWCVVPRSGASVLSFYLGPWFCQGCCSLNFKKSCCPRSSIYVFSGCPLSLLDFCLHSWLFDQRCLHPLLQTISTPSGFHSCPTHGKSAAQTIV